MNTRIHCEHCNRYYETNLEDARLMEKFHSERIKFANNTYYYKNKECFFTVVKKLKALNIEE